MIWLLTCPWKMEPKITSRMIGKAKVKITASFSRKNILVSAAALDHPVARTEGSGWGVRAVAVAAGGATVSLMETSDGGKGRVRGRTGRRARQAPSWAEPMSPR
ncbi:hypothetical protein Ssi03_09660 [Sphaerisporangium siamense]|nr:hypothetical protein Ssi03_09660 [Sphaerisporangium siamense]